MAGEAPPGGTIEAARRGEAWAVGAVAELIREFARHVAGTRFRSSGAPELDWEDLAQEASRRFFCAGIHQFRGTGAERSYLYSIVKATWIQQARSAVRRRRREEVSSPPDEPPATVNPTSRLEVEGILAHLDPACREILEQIFFDGMSYAELAVTTGLVESSLRAKVSRCIRRAREQAI